MRSKLSHIILVVSLIVIWFMGSVGGNAWHVLTSHFCYESMSFTIGHHNNAACHSSCCNSSNGNKRAKSSSCSDCATCTSSSKGEGCFCKEASDIQSELVRHSNLILAFDQIKQLCVCLFDSGSAIQPRQWHTPPLLCFPSRHLLSMYAVLII